VPLNQIYLTGMSLWFICFYEIASRHASLAASANARNDIGHAERYFLLLAFVILLDMLPPHFFSILMK